MPRPTGRRNDDFELKRRALARRARVAWLSQGAGISLRDFAEATDSSLTNLKHYFGDRDGLVEAMTSVCHEDSLPILARVSQPQGEDARGSLLIFFDQLLLGWQNFGVGRLHEVGLSESLGDARLGPAFVNNILEPSLQSTEQLLAILVERQQLPQMEVRAAALSLMSPVILALLHQGGLMGDRCRPLNVHDFIRVHVDHWLSGWAQG